MDNQDIDVVRETLVAHKRRLAIRQKQKALQGYSSDPEVDLEIEDIKMAVRELEQYIRECEFQSAIKKDDNLIEKKGNKSVALIRLLLHIVHESVFITAAAALAGGFLWIVLNRLLGWYTDAGGSGNEPHGLNAALWGFIGFLPIFFCAMLACRIYVYSNWKELWKWLTATILYLASGAIGAVLFYDYGFRGFVEAANLGYPGQELIIVFIWSFILAFSSCLPLLLLYNTYNSIVDPWYLMLLQISCAVIFSMIGVILSFFFIGRPIEEVNQIRGIFAGIGLRIGLFSGLVLSIYTRYYKEKHTSSLKLGTN